MRKYFIDVLEKSVDKKHGEDIEFVNILYYAKNNYGLSVSRMADYFGVERQTVYNYFQLNSQLIPERVKQLIAYIYDVISYNEVLEIELKVFNIVNIGIPLAYENVDNSSIKDILEIYKELDFEMDGAIPRITLKEHYRLGLLWNTKISKKNSDHVFKATSSPKLYNSEFQQLINQIDPNDKEFIDLVNHYIESKESIKQIIITDEHQIKKRLAVTTQTSNLITLKMEEIISFPKVVLSIRFSCTDDLKTMDILVDYETPKLIVALLSINEDLSIGIINKIKELIAKLMPESEIKLSINIDNKSNIIDLLLCY